MLIHPEIDPIAIQIGPLAVRWYGLMYLAAFAMFLLLGRYRARQQILRSWKPADLDDLLLYGILGVVLRWAHRLLPVLQTGLLPSPIRWKFSRYGGVA